METKIIAGKKSSLPFKHVPLAEIVGKTIQAIGTTTVDGPNGQEPCTILFFTDRTKHGFVHPTNDE